MTIKQRLSLTHTIIRYDMYLNWFLALALLFFPGFSSLLLSSSYLLPKTVFTIMGLGFLFFATWQRDFIVKPHVLTSAQLIAAAWLAWIPVIFLTYALVFVHFPLYPLAATLLWVGNIYMLLLGFWYYSLAQRLK